MDGRAEQRLTRVGAGEVQGAGAVEVRTGEDRVGAGLAVHALAAPGGVQARGEGQDARGQREAGVAGGEAGGDGEPAARGVPGEHDAGRVLSAVEEGPVGVHAVLDRGREGMFGGEPVVQRVRPEAGLGDEVSGQGQGRLGGAEHPGPTVEVEDRSGARSGLRLDPQGRSPAEFRRRGAEALGHLHAGHERTESGAHLLDRGRALVAALPHHGIDAGTLFSAHTGVLPG